MRDTAPAWYKPIVIPCVVTLFCLPSNNRAHASELVDWRDGVLTQGEHYRIILVTWVTYSALGDIGDYNSWVTGAAVGSEVNAMLEHSKTNRVDWRALVSTTTTSAAENISTGSYGEIDDPSASIYTVDGRLVASSTSDLWDGAIDNPIDRDPDNHRIFPYGGGPFPPTYVLSGSSADGSADDLGMVAGLIPGVGWRAGSMVQTGNVAYGVTEGTNDAWINWGSAGSKQVGYRLYGISSVQTYSAPIPEPTTLELFALTLLGTTGRRRRSITTHWTGLTTAALADLTAL